MREARMSIIGIYFEDVSRFARITPQRERELSLKIKGGDKEALDELITSNLRLAATIARDWARKKWGKVLPLEDLIQRANVGLCIAARKFDPQTYNVRFCTYAHYWINQEIRRALIGPEGNRVHVPAYLRDLMSQWHRLDCPEEQKPARIKMSKVGRSARFTNKTLACLKKAMAALKFTFSPVGECFDMPQRESEGGLSSEDLEVLRSAMSVLSERSRYVIEQRFLAKRALAEIGEDLGIVRERVRQIEQEAIEKLRKCEELRVLHEEVVGG